MDILKSITSSVNIHDGNQLYIELHHIHVPKASRGESEILSAMGEKTQMITKNQRMRKTLGFEDLRGK